VDAIRRFLLCLPSCCRPVSGLLPTYYRRISDVFFTCFPRVPVSTREAIKPLSYRKNSAIPGPGRPKMHQKTEITRDFRLKAETSSLQTACTAIIQIRTFSGLIRSVPNAADLQAFGVGLRTSPSPQRVAAGN